MKVQDWHEMRGRTVRDVWERHKLFEKSYSLVQTAQAQCVVMCALNSRVPLHNPTRPVSYGFMVDLRRDVIGLQPPLFPRLLRSHFLWLVEQNCSISLILSHHPLDAGISQHFQNFHFTSSRAGRVNVSQLLFLFQHSFS